MSSPAMKTIFGVITHIERENDASGCYDVMAQKDFEGVWSTVAEFDAKKPYIQLHLPVFKLGEILILESEWKREVSGRCRSPRKWFVTCEEFEYLEEAIDRAKEVMK